MGDTPGCRYRGQHRAPSGYLPIPSGGSPAVGGGGEGQKPPGPDGAVAAALSPRPGGGLGSVPPRPRSLSAPRRGAAPTASRRRAEPPRRGGRRTMGSQGSKAAKAEGGAPPAGHAAATEPSKANGQVGTGMEGTGREAPCAPDAQTKAVAAARRGGGG